MKRFLNFGALALALTIGATALPLQANVEQEIGQSLAGLDAKHAERLLNRYVEGKILTFAGKAPRVELLSAILKVAPQGTVFRKRASLLLQSAKTSWRK